MRPSFQLDRVPNLPTRLEQRGVPLELRHRGSALGEEQRRELLRLVRSGEPVELDIEAIVYIQRDRPNANFTRFRKSILQGLAKSFEGQPFLRDHNGWNLQARGGTIARSVLTHVQEEDGEWPAFRQTIRLVKDWAVEGALDGTLDRFSIAWDPGRDWSSILCSVCDESMLECSHWPGDVVEVDGEERVVELIFTKAAGRETSGLSIPAVDGTEITDIRAALQAARQGGAPPRRQGSMSKKMKALAAIVLGANVTIPEDDDQALDQILAGAEKLAARATRAEDTLETEQAAHELTRVSLKRARDDLAAGEGLRLDALIESAIAAGKIRPRRDEQGKAVPSKLEASIRKLAKDLGYDVAKERIDELEATVPIGDPPASRGTAPASRAGGGANQYGLNAAEQKTARSMGLSDKEFAAEKAHLKGEKFEDDDGDDIEIEDDDEDKED